MRHGYSRWTNWRVLRKGASQAIRDILTSASFALQPITDVDAPLRWEFGPNDLQVTDLPAEQLSWFVDHRQAIVESMRLSAQGAALSKKYDCDFTSRLRPPANTPAALVIAGGRIQAFNSPAPSLPSVSVFVD